jgi:TRAP-type C4-dicarboxylate transport system permease small subunit
MIAVRKALAGVATLLWWSLFVAVAVMLACVTLQVVMRYIFHRAPSWTEELAVLMFAWASLGALALGVREGFHVRLSLLLDALGPRARAAADRVIEAVTAAIGAYLAWSGLRFVDMTSGTVSAAIAYPIEILHTMAPLCGALVFLFAAERVLLGPPKPPPVPEVPASVQM